MLDGCAYDGGIHPFNLIEFPQSQNLLAWRRTLWWMLVRWPSLAILCWLIPLVSNVSRFRSHALLLKSKRSDLQRRNGPHPMCVTQAQSVTSKCTFSVCNHNRTWQSRDLEHRSGIGQPDRSICKTMPITTGAIDIFRRLSVHAFARVRSAQLYRVGKALWSPIWQF